MKKLHLRELQRGKFRWVCSKEFPLDSGVSTSIDKTHLDLDESFEEEVKLFVYEPIKDYSYEELPVPGPREFPERVGYAPEFRGIEPYLDIADEMFNSYSITPPKLVFQENGLFLTRAELEFEREVAFEGDFDETVLFDVEVTGFGKGPTEEFSKASCLSELIEQSVLRAPGYSPVLELRTIDELEEEGGRFQTPLPSKYIKSDLPILWEVYEGISFPAGRLSNSPIYISHLMGKDTHVFKAVTHPSAMSFDPEFSKFHALCEHYEDVLSWIVEKEIDEGCEFEEFAGSLCSVPYSKNHLENLKNTRFHSAWMGARFGSLSECIEASFKGRKVDRKVVNERLKECSGIEFEAMDSTKELSEFVDGVPGGVGYFKLDPSAEVYRLLSPLPHSNVFLRTLFGKQIEEL